MDARVGQRGGRPVRGTSNEAQPTDTVTEYLLSILVTGIFLCLYFTIRKGWGTAIALVAVGSQASISLWWAGALPEVNAARLLLPSWLGEVPAVLGVKVLMVRRLVIPHLRIIICLPIAMSVSAVRPAPHWSVVDKCAVSHSAASS